MATKSKKKPAPKKKAPAKKKPTPRIDVLRLPESEARKLLIEDAPRPFVSAPAPRPADSAPSLLSFPEGTRVAFMQGGARKLGRVYAHGAAHIVVRPDGADHLTGCIDMAPGDLSTAYGE